MARKMYNKKKPLRGPCDQPPRYESSEDGNGNLPDGPGPLTLIKVPVLLVKRT